MRIDRLKIRKYKNLVDCEFDFSNSDGLLVIAGINGSGKSNLLEAILLIMKDVCSIPKPVNVDWPLYEISFVGKNEAVTASRDSNECDRPSVVRKLINGVDEVVHEQPSVVYMYGGEFNRIYNSRLGYVSEFEMSRGFYAITAEDLNVATIVLAIKSHRGAIQDVGRLISLPNVSAVTLHSEGVHVNVESGPDNELEDLALWLSQQAEVGDKIYVHIEALSDKLAQLGVDDPRDQYYVLSQILGDVELYGFSDIGIVLESASSLQMPIENLSEGEKRLLLLRFVYEVLGKDGSLMLLDEPDAHVHEGRKIDLYSYLEANCGNESFTICTSHSPGIVNTVQENSLIGLRLDEDGKVRVVEKDAISTFRDIADERMGYFSTKPIVLFEGKSDIVLLKKAVEYFRQNIDGYENLSIDRDFEFYLMGGTGNAVYCYEELKKICGSRRVFVVLDHDGAGKTQIEKFQRMIRGQHCNIFVREDTEPFPAVGDCVFRIPPPEGYTGDTYMIEDYLPKEYYHRWIDNWKNHKVTCFHSIVNFMDSLKKEIGGNATQFLNGELFGFKPLIDVMRGISVAQGGAPASR